MQYKGFKYTSWIEYEEDNAKTWHGAVDLDGRIIPFDWSPYSTPTPADFRAWIDLGMPRMGSTPLSQRDLQDLSRSY